MAYSSTTSLVLDMHSESENTDDDKTPEYPLSDDHPLSLINRSKLLNAFKLSPKCQMEETSSIQSDMLLNQTNTIVDSSDDCKISGGHVSCASQQPGSIDSNEKCHLPSPCDILPGMSDDLPRQSQQKRNHKKVMEVLDLASGPYSGITKPKTHFSKRGVSLQVRSLIDFFGGHGVIRLYETDQRNSTNNLKPAITALETSNKYQEFYSASLTDSNNNSGQPSWQSPKLKTEINTSIFQHDISWSMPLSVFGHKQNCNNNNFFEFTIDNKDTAPPHLFPVIDVNSKSETTINSQDPSFPPLLSPLIADAACISLSLEDSFVRNKSIQSQISKGPIQRDTMASDTSLNMSLSPDRSTGQTVISSPNVVNLVRISGPNSSSNDADTLLEEVKENGRKKTCKDYPGQIPKWKGYEVPKLTSEKVDSGQFPSSLPIQEGSGKIQKHSKSRPLTFSEIDGVSSKKCQDVTFSVHNDRFEGYQSPPKPKRVKLETLPTDGKKEASQTFLSTEAKSVASSETTLCYPYSTQTSQENQGLTTKESEPRLSVMPKNSTIVCNGIAQAKMPLKEQLPYSFIEDAFDSQNVPTTFESFPIMLSTPTISLTSPVSSIAPSLLPIGDFPTLVKSGSASSKFPSIVETENCHLHAPHNERVLGPMTTSAGHIGAIDFYTSVDNSTFPTESPVLQAENTKLSNNEHQKRLHHKSYYVYEEWSGPSPVTPDWSKQENALQFSNKFDTPESHLVDLKKVQNPTSDQTTWRDSPLVTEYTQSKAGQKSCKLGMNSLWKVQKVESPSDLLLKSNQANGHTARQIPKLAENEIIRHDNLNDLSNFESKRTDLHGPSSSLRPGTGQSEPLDLSSKPSPLHCATPRTLEVMVKSMAKISPFVRCLEHENRKDNVFEHKRNNSLQRDMKHLIDMKSSLNCELINVNTRFGNANKESPSDLLVEADQVVENSERDREKYEPGSQSATSSIIQHEETDELSLPNEPNLVIDLEDDQVEFSPLKSIQVKENRKGLPVDNYCSLNPVEKSYSHLAFAAITSKKKKSLASCLIPSENEDFLGFLRRDTSTCNSDVNKEKKVDFALFSKLSKGEFIDLTENNEDVLSVSSDGSIENMSVLNETENETVDKNDRSSPHADIYKAMSIPAMGRCTRRTEDVNNRIESTGSSHDGITENVSEMVRLKDCQFPGKEGCRPKISYDETIKKEDGRYPAWHHNSSGVFDDSKLSFMKEQSLTFSPPQKAKMAKRIQDIISRNSKLLPECMQQSSSSPSASVSNLSERSNLFKSAARYLTPSTSKAGYSTPFMSEAGHSTPICTHSLHDFHNSFPQHIKVKRSLSLEDTPASTRCVQPHQKGTALRCRSVTFSHQKPHLCVQLPTDKECETAQMRVTEDDELNPEESSPYKTVWQTQFFTENPPCFFGDSEHKIAGRTFPTTINNEDFVQRLELMHDASNSLNQASHTNMTRESTSGETSNQERKRRGNFATEMFPQLEYSSGEMITDALPHPLRPISHSQIDNGHNLPPVSGQLNQFIPSTFVVAPYYAMAYPVCYPALQRANAPDHPILLSHHNGSLNVFEGVACRPNGRKRTKRVKPEVRPKRKKTRKATRTNDSQRGITTQDKSNELPKSPLLTLPDIDLNPIKIAEKTIDTVQNCLTAKIHDSVNLDTQRSRDLQILELAGHNGNIQDPMAPESGGSCFLKTRKEDGLTILSKHCADEYNSSVTDETERSDKRETFCNSFENSSYSDHKPSKSFFPSLDSLSAKSREFNILDTSTSAKPDDAVGQNLVTLALASETHKRIQTPACFQLVTPEKMSADINRTRMNDHSKASNWDVNEMCISPENNVATQSRTQISHTTFPVGKECQGNQEKTITEKEKLVTEMLAAMMQNRNLTSEEKSSEPENADSF